MRAAAFLFLMMAGFWGEASALHKADHRYTIAGYVRDEAGLPKPDTEVVIEHKEGGQKQKIKTDRSGYYKALFHLHNDNLGDELTVTAGSEVKKISVAFDPVDTVSHRGADVDFGAPAQAGIGRWVYWGGGAFFTGLFLYFFLRKNWMKKKKDLKQRGRKKERG